MPIKFCFKHKCEMYVPSKPKKYGCKLLYPTNATPESVIYIMPTYICCRKDTSNLKLSNKDKNIDSIPSVIHHIKLINQHIER